ncbi:hypothetical protein ACTFIW_007502 [Dictyostelium discoideum]
MVSVPLVVLALVSLLLVSSLNNLLWITITIGPKSPTSHFKLSNRTKRYFPEGLPMMIAIVLSLNMRKLLKAKVLVRKLLGIETAGKFIPRTFISGSAHTYKGFNQIPKELREVLSFTVRESTSSVIGEDGQIVGGNASDKALLQFLDKESLLADYQVKVEKRYFSIPEKIFSCIIKGNTKWWTNWSTRDCISNRCTSHFNEDGHIEPIPDSVGLTNSISSLSEQVLFSLVSLVLYDEIREESRSSIQTARSAGIQVVMITGDKKKLPLPLQNLSDNKLANMLPHLRVVSRALPSDKVRFVNVAQSLHKVVGMTGDGVNDSAALKHADVGFAMGSGSEVSKEAADIVILDDNFASITQAVLYGRTIYKSIQKFIVFQSTINVASTLIVFLGPFMGFDFPLTLIQLLWVNLVMDTLAALAFGGEPALTRYMQEKPIKRDQSIITSRMWGSILGGGPFISAMSHSFSYQ